MSKYEEELEKLEHLKCKGCHGSGKLDDAGPGDISFNEWDCKACEGTGLFGPVEHDPQVEGSNTIWLRKQLDNMQNYIEATCVKPYLTHQLCEVEGRVVLMYSLGKEAWAVMLAEADKVTEGTVET